MLLVCVRVCVCVCVYVWVWIDEKLEGARGSCRRVPRGRSIYAECKRALVRYTQVLEALLTPDKEWL